MIDVDHKSTGDEVGVGHDIFGSINWTNRNTTGLKADERVVGAQTAGNQSYRVTAGTEDLGDHWIFLDLDHPDVLVGATEFQKWGQREFLVEPELDQPLVEHLELFGSTRRHTGV